MDERAPRAKLEAKLVSYNANAPLYMYVYVYTGKCVYVDNVHMRAGQSSRHSLSLMTHHVSIHDTNVDSKYDTGIYMEYRGI